MSAKIFATNARAYINKKISVIPCFGKRPAPKAWQEYSRRLPREDELGRWETDFDWTNLGVVCGEASDVICLDIDNEAWLTLEAIPQSTVKKVGKKGESRFFRLPKPTPARMLESFSVPGFDYLANSRQSILPPSVHPDTGRPYRWTEGKLLETERPILTEEQFDTLYRLMKAPPQLALPAGEDPGSGNSVKTAKSINVEEQKPGPGPGSEILGRNNRLKSVAQAIFHRTQDMAEATREVWMTDLREHGTRSQCEGLGVGADFEAAWDAVQGRWNGKSELDYQHLNAERRCLPLFLDSKEAAGNRRSLGLEGAREFILSLARTEQRRGLALIEAREELRIEVASPEAPRVVTPELMPTPRGRPKSAHRETAQVQRPDGVMGEFYDETMRGNFGEFELNALAVGSAVFLMSALAQHRFIPGFGTRSTSSLTVMLADSGVGKTLALATPSRILQNLGFTPSGGWKSGGILQEELIAERNQIAIVDEASSFFSTMAQQKPHAVELQDTLTKIMTHPAIGGGKLTFATSKAGRAEGTASFVVSPGLTMVLATTPNGLLNSADRSIGQRGFMARAIFFTQKRKMLSVNEIDRRKDELGESRLKELTEWAREFIKTNPIQYDNGEMDTTEANYTGSHSIEHGRTHSMVLTKPLELNGPRHFEVKPRIVPFTDEAKAMIRKIHRENFSAIEGVEGGGAAESRFSELASRLSFLHCISRKGGSPSVEIIDAQWGIQTATILLREYKEFMAALEMPPGLHLESLIIARVQAGRNTERLIKSSMRNNRFDSRAILQAIDDLVRDGTLEEYRPPGTRTRHLRFPQPALKALPSAPTPTEGTSNVD